MQLYDTSGSLEPKKVSIGNGMLISHLPFDNSCSRGDWKVIVDNENGKEIWQLSIKELNRHIDGNFYSYRLALPYLYLVVSKEQNFKPHPTKQHYVVPNPTFWQLITVDLQSGKVIQEISLGTEKQEECRIEDVDEDGILIGKTNKEILYYERST